MTEYHVRLISDSIAEEVGQDMIFEILEGEFSGMMFAFKTSTQEDGELKIEYDLLYNNGFSTNEEKKRFDSVVYDIFLDMQEELDAWENPVTEEIVEDEEESEEAPIEEDDEYTYNYEYQEVTDDRDWD